MAPGRGFQEDVIELPAGPPGLAPVLQSSSFKRRHLANDARLAFTGQI
jgi:hypothetical protein